MWLCPFTESSENGMIHEIADLNNISSHRPLEGCTSAASFIFKSVKKGVKVAHLDIACASTKGHFDLNNHFGNG